MKKELWVVIIVVGIFVGLITGYSVAPMLEVGMIGGDKNKPGINIEINTDLADHYKQLSSDDAD